MDIPDRFIRGIPHESFIIDGALKIDLFYYEGNVDRGDGWVERSINWEDDDDAISFTLNRIHSNGSIHFSGGVTLIDTDVIEDIRDRPPTQGYFGFERHSLPNNQYHGNLLMIADLPKHLRTLIAANLAFHGSRNIIPQNDQGNL